MALLVLEGSLDHLLGLRIVLAEQTVSPASRESADTPETKNLYMQIHLGVYRVQIVGETCIHARSQYHTANLPTLILL